MEVSLVVFVVLLVINGALINGPYGMITTAVSSDLVGNITFDWLSPYQSVSLYLRGGPT